MRYTFLGPAGTFTEQALLNLAGADANRIPSTSVPAALERVASGEVDAANGSY